MQTVVVRYEVLDALGRTFQQQAALLDPVELGRLATLGAAAMAGLASAAVLTELGGRWAAALTAVLERWQRLAQLTASAALAYAQADRDAGRETGPDAGLGAGLDAGLEIPPPGTAAAP